MTRVIFSACARFAWDLQNRSVSALGRFRFFEVQRLYKTIGTCRDHRKTPYWIDFRFFQGPDYIVFTVYMLYKLLNSGWFWVLGIMIGDNMTKSAGNSVMGTTVISSVSNKIYLITLYC